MKNKLFICAFLSLFMAATMASCDDSNSGNGEEPVYDGKATAMKLTWPSNLDGSVQSVDYVLRNLTTGEVIKNTATNGDVCQFSAEDIAKNKIDLSLAPKSTYSIAAMAIVANSNSRGESVEMPKTDVMSEIWVEDHKGSLKNNDLYWGVVNMKAGAPAEVSMEQVNGQVYFDVNNPSKSIVVDSVYFSIPEKYLSTSVTRYGNLQAGGSGVASWKVDPIFNMLPTQQVCKEATLKVYATNPLGEVLTQEFPLSLFEVKVGKCTHIQIGLDWPSYEQGAIKVNVTWEDPIIIDAKAEDAEDLTVNAPFESLNADKVYWNYIQLTDVQKKVFKEVYESVLGYDDKGMALPSITVPISEELLAEPTIEQDIIEVSNIITRDVPQIFHFKNVRKLNNYYRIGLSLAYSDFAVRYSRAIKGADAILKRLPQGMSEFETVKWLYEEFLRSVSYGQKQGSEGSLYGAFFYHKIVCEGYARAFQYLCQKAGIQALYMEGTYSPNGASMSHAWNIVRVDGKYYWCDPTADDGMTEGSTTVFYDNFMKCSNTFFSSKCYYHFPSKTFAYPEINASDYVWTNNNQ